MFEGLEPEDLHELASRLRERRLRENETLFEGGDAADSMFIVLEGKVNIFLYADGMRRVSVADLVKGMFFGEMALFDNKPRSAGAVAVTDTLLLELDRVVLTQYLERRPRAAMAIVRTTSERLRKTLSMVSERTARNVIEEFERGLSWADRLADKIAEVNGSWAFILLLSGITAVWMLINIPGLCFSTPPDGFPYQFFNLLLAVLVSLQGPLIVMSQNRQAAKERKEAENDFKVNLKNEVNIETILREVSVLRADVNARLDKLERKSE